MKRIKINSLSADKNMAQLAAGIVDKCKYIHPSRIEEIEQLLIKLRKFHQQNPASSATAAQTQAPMMNNFTAAPNTSGNRQQQQQQQQQSAYEDNYNNRGDQRVNNNRNSVAKPQPSMQQRQYSEDHTENDSLSSSQYRSRQPTTVNRERERVVDQLPPADMNQLDEYLEMLYQVSGKTDKEKEAGLKMQERGTAMILKLCREVMNLEHLIQNSTVMGAITRVLQEEYKKSIELTFNILRIFLAFSNFLEMHSLMANYKIGVLTMKSLEFEIKRIELREQERLEREQETAEDLKRIRDDTPADYPKAVEKNQRAKEKELAKHKAFLKKQDKVFLVGFYILLNLAEDITTERKMIKKGLIPMLIAMLTHTSEELLELILRFLKKLAIYEENKDALKELNVIELLNKFLTCSSEVLVKMVLRLLFNLSFDKVSDALLKEYCFLLITVSLFCY
jgi:hypothetical protein